MYQLIRVNGHITKDKQKRNLMFIHQHMQMLGLQKSIKQQVVVGKRDNHERSKRKLLGRIPTNRNER